MVIQKWKVQGSTDGLSPFGTVCDSDRHVHETLVEGRKGTALAESNQAQSKMNFTDWNDIIIMSHYDE